MHANNFARVDALFPNGAKHTYLNEALNQHNKLDYFVYDNISVTSFDVIDPDVNFSDHLPIAVDLCINVGPTAVSGSDVIVGRLYIYHSSLGSC